MKLLKLLFACLLVSFTSFAQVPSVGQKNGSKSSIEGCKGWYEPDSGLIVPTKNAKLSAAGIQFNKPGRFWFDRYGDSSYHGWDGVREFLLLSIKDTALIRSLASAGNDAQTLSLSGKDLSILNGNTVTLPFAYSVAFLDTAALHWAAIQGKQASLGFTPENVANKVQTISSPNSTDYPSTTAVNSALGAYKLKGDSTGTGGFTTHYQDDTGKNNIRAQIAGITESDPIALAKTVTIGNGYGITGGGGAQAISANPSRTLAIDTVTVFPAIRATIPAATETDPVANAHTVTVGSGYGLTGGGAAQALSTNPARTIVLDTGTVFPALRSTLPAESDPVANAHTVTVGTGYGLTGGGAAQALSANPSRTIVLDTATIYAGLWSTIAPGTGIGISGRTITNTLPDQTVVLTNGTGISITGTYPNFTVTNTSTGTTDHAALSNLSWTSSAHTGTASNLAGWNGSNVAAVYGLSGTGTTIPTTTGPTFTNPVVGTQTYPDGSTKGASTAYVDNNFAALTGATFTGTVIIPKLAVNNQTGTSYTLVLTDAGKWVTSNNGSAVTFTVPLNSSVAFPVDTYITFANYGAGAITVTPTGGVTINGTDANRKFVQYAEGYIHKTATDTWIIGGKTTP